MKTLSIALLVVALSCILHACAAIEEQPRFSEEHLQKAEAPVRRDEIPPPVVTAPALPLPEPFQDETTHTVVVFDVPVSEVLFALARDSELNLDLDPDVATRISLNAVDQPLRALLDRICGMAGLRYRIENGVLRVHKDTPYLRNYPIDYLNISRTAEGSVAVSTQISATGQGGGGAGADSSGNNSNTRVRSVSENAYWDTLAHNLGMILDSGKAPAVAEGTARSDVIVNRESGTIAVRATERQHRDVEKFLEQVLKATQRQVLIEATIAEVDLNDTFQAGIDWSLLDLGGTRGINITQALTDVALNSPPTFTLSASDLDLNGNELQITLKALETFGDVKVMSSPKVLAMNNQTAMLKVVDNLVYFTVDVNIENPSALDNAGRLTSYETEVNTVPVGFVMSVTPFINDENVVILDVRPTISRVINYVNDPNPALADANVVSQIPVIQVREVESILTVASGDTAIIGGLMQDESKRATKGVPLLHRLPVLGAPFRYKDDLTRKTELVIFLKPTVIARAGSSGDRGEASGSTVR